MPYHNHLKTIILWWSDNKTKWVSLSYLNCKRIENSVHVFAESDQGSAEPVGAKKVWLMKINEKLWCLILVLAHHL